MEINWVTVFEIVLGATLGFLSSILLGALTKSVGAHRLKRKMKLEIKSIEKNIETNININNRFEVVSPIWDYIINADTLFLYRSSNYERIIKLYGEMRAFERSEADENLSFEEIMENRKRLLQAIKSNPL
ncbi:MAG: hypothetical protein J6P37_05295 [Lachnospiraceae bacterium]|nr:hypothetical protein [Lachnospiraceae bacterium]